MSPTLGETNDAATEWLAQLKVLQQSLAELNLSQFNNGGTSYGKDIVVDHDNSTEPSSGDDVWDYLTEDDENSQSSDESYETEEQLLGDLHGVQGYDLSWLSEKCQYLAVKQSGLTAPELQDQLSALLDSDLQSRVFSSKTFHYQLTW